MSGNGTVQVRPARRILVADDYLVVRKGLVTVINSQPDMIVVAEAMNGRQAVEDHSEKKENNDGHKKENHLSPGDRPDELSDGLGNLVRCQDP